MEMASYKFNYFVVYLILVLLLMMSETCNERKNKDYVRTGGWALSY